MAKQRVSVTVSEDLLESIDEEAERKGINRSRMVEEALRDYVSSLMVDTAVFFCGGAEARSLEEHEGKEVILHVLDRLDGVSRVLLLCGENERELRELLSSSHEGKDLEYFSDEEEGTATALSRVKDEIETTFVAMNGHVVSDVDLGEMVSLHREEGRIATMALTTVEDTTDYGVVRLKGTRILGFEEKPGKGEEPSKLINAGTYILEPDIFDLLDEDSIESVFEKLAGEGELTGYIYGGRWTDLNQE